MAILRVSPEAFLNLQEAGSIVDVRSPSEYIHAHIPGAINVPLFSDAVRAEIGTLYTKVGREQAIARGFKDLNGRLESLRNTLLSQAASGAVRIHCWRGGMRSESVAWLVERSGYVPYLLEGGYKNYRHSVLSQFAQPYELLVLSGMTGAGKAEVLLELQKLGEQVIDLEGLAHHKGSAFGWLGEEPQPSTEQFENELAYQLRALSPKRRLWLEDESKNIGKVLIPTGLYKQMSCAPRIVLETEPQARLERLLRVYTHYAPEELVACVEKIRKRLGGDKANECIQLILTGALAPAIELVLAYYDKQYRYGITSKNTEYQIIRPESSVPREIALQLLDALK